ncbi:MAG: 3-hydroxyacyl-ACP dehydratase FabZ [Gammaproteobacteria bacterium]|nr:3-hydroxyacyl-ACP dehydratase FabZ [Gammaproteobacteria bacterium]
MSIHEVLEYLPHRYPFLLIDRVLDIELGSHLTAIKNVTFNEPFFTGHFPNRPVFPGVLMLEAMAQATGILVFKTNEKKPTDKSLYLFVSIDKARFKRQVEPGDQLTIKVKLLKQKRGMWKFATEAWVGDELACSAELMGAEREIDS